MKTLPKYPYLKNIVTHYNESHRSVLYEASTGWRGFDKDYPDWLRQFGFKVPVEGDRLEFPADFTDQQLVLFILRWA